MRYRRTGAGVVLAVIGDIDLATVARFRAGVRRAAEAAADLAVPLLIDLRGVGFLSAVGLRGLAAARVNCSAAGRAVLVIADQAAVLAPLRITGMDRALTVLPAPPRVATESRYRHGHA